MTTDYLDSVMKQFEYYKMLGDKTFAQLTDEHLFWQYNRESNSIAVIVKHLWGNMLSRWTDFLNTDGEKEWRNREAEFENDITTRQELLDKWNAGWNCLFDALKSITGDDLQKEIYIRNMGHTVMEAINRHCALSLSVGQIVFIGRCYAMKTWTSLSIPRGKSNDTTQTSFSKPKHEQHFTDEFINKKNNSGQYWFINVGLYFLYYSFPQMKVGK
jgi:hypothetical protein